MKLLQKFSLLFVSVLLVQTAMAGNDYKEITLSDLYKNNEYSARSVSGLRSMNDGEHYSVLEAGKRIVKFSYATGKAVATLFDLSTLENQDIPYIFEYTFSKDEKKILVETHYEKIYRRSYKAEFYIWDIAEKTLTPLSENGKQQLAAFSPDGNKVAFVRDNNIFIKDLQDSTEKQITNDGKYNEIINGSCDWVYEEEFGFTRAFNWSPDGKKIAFYRFDESQVKTFNMTIYDDYLYPKNYTFKYPKAGEKNSVVQIKVYDLESGKFNNMDIGPETDQYIPRIKWSNDPSMLAIIRMNRLQNEIEILMGDASTGNTSVIYQETNKYYISEIDDQYLNFINDKNDFIIYSEKSGFKHFYLLDANGNVKRQITKGQWDVVDYLGYDVDSKLLYYTSTENSPLRRDVYAIKLNGRKKEKISVNEGTNDAVFSKTFKYYINYYSSATVPTMVTLHDASGKLVRVLEDNKDLMEKVKATGVPDKEFFTFTTSEGVSLNGWMIKPADFDPAKKYPVLMYVYGGPGSQTVTDSWSFGWYQLLAQKGYVIVSVDNRGTGFRGEEFKKMTYGELGHYETIDQIETAKYLGALDYVDSTRIGIFGWSYGGYMSTLCITKGADYFKTAIAVAPVTNWRFYDTVYTERYMGLPQDNPHGYDDNSPINYVDRLKGHYLLVHGTGDDNVHFQNTMVLTEKLVQANKQFEMQIYPDKDHGIRGGNTSLHLYTRMTDYLLKNL
ncbi:MAG TPA: S9 family peptidase [Bacteroidales bacterium]|nr:S9 family peptidase [Bacteroidales bacterium]